MAFVTHKYSWVLAGCFLLPIFLQSLNAANARFRSVDVPIEYGQLLVRSIEQDKSGLMLFGTDNGAFQFDGYQLLPYPNTSAKNSELRNIPINDILTESHGGLWLATRGSGLYYYAAGKIKHFGGSSDSELSADFISEVYMDTKGTLWLVTNRGLFSISDEFKVTTYENAEVDNPSWQFMTTLVALDNDQLLIGTKAGLTLFNQKNQSFQNIHLLSEAEKTIVYSIHQDDSGGIWVGSNDGAFYRPHGEERFVAFMPDTIPYKILSIKSRGDDVWLGTISNGLFHFSLEKQRIQQFIYQRQTENSLSDNTILDLFIDTTGVLWVSTFYKGLNTLDIHSLRFGLENDAAGSVECAENLLFSGFAEDSLGNVWIANGTSLLKFNKQTATCERFAFNQGSETIKFLRFDSQNQFWTATTKGLYRFDRQLKEFVGLNISNEQSLTHFVVEEELGVLLLGTNDGLQRYDMNKNQLNQIKTSKSMNQGLKVYGYATSPQEKMYFATNAGVMYLLNNQLQPAKNIQHQVKGLDILQVYFDSSGQLWVGTDGEGVFVFNQQGSLVFEERQFGDVRSDSITSIIEAANGDMWLGTKDSGLIRVKANSKAFKVYYPSDGIQGMSFIINASYRSEDDRLYFGGRNGFNAFDPQLLKTDIQTPKVALTDLTRFGQSVPVSYSGDDVENDADAFKLRAPINELQELRLGHQDYVIGFEFSVLDFSDPMRNQYAYQMEGLDPDWNYVNAENRRISYSNLRPGKYVFKVKGANKNGVWNNTGKSIQVKVLPAPWLTWWAITSYFVLSLMLLAWLFNRKTRLNQQINLRLTSEVEKQTHALQTEKKTVEALLAKKNELFANVSHEFRTPLTLILGPVKRLLSSPLNAEQNQTLKVINRNANRLLTMIEQLLHLAKMSGTNDIEFHDTAAHVTVEALVNAFQTLAANKRITLNLICNDGAVVRLSQDALDVILSNLLSNAIKYTPEGGKIELKSSLQDGILCIQVKDTGPGLNAEQQLSIFKRFKRLDRDQNIEGIGIGLSVVKELVELNCGTITIKSEPAKGSCFTVVFAALESQEVSDDDSTEVSLVKQLSQIEEPKPNLTEVAVWHDGDPVEKVLIIDDNADMRQHIAESLNSHYHCLLANGGKEGIALAIQYVPDVVICDVMMPEVDGFHVSRVLRSDTRTSHIPLVMLTALDDKESRVRGWREHVDVYLTKPFDAAELLLQLDNILVIRSILNKKAAASVKAGQDASLIDLPKKDQEFINKLNQIIKDNYQQPIYSRQQMASEMAVSERQLQRKLKALIDKNPIDLLREYRLSQAAIMLKDGYQVSITSDSCGFNSLPHFSKCFKSQYGLSPKAYQMACKSLK